MNLFNALFSNVNNPSYMKILLNGKASIEEVFADIDIKTLRDAVTTKM